MTDAEWLQKLLQQKGESIANLIAPKLPVNCSIKQAKNESLEWFVVLKTESFSRINGVAHRKERLLHIGGFCYEQEVWFRTTGPCYPKLAALQEEIRQIVNNAIESFKSGEIAA